MKLTNKKFALATMLMAMMPTVVNAASNEVIARGLSEWVSIVAELLSVFCLIIFAIYMGRFFSIKTDKDAENDEKIAPGVKNGMMTCLIGIAICQATIIVVQLFFK